MLAGLALLSALRSARDARRSTEAADRSSAAAEKTAKAAPTTAKATSQQVRMIREEVAAARAERSRRAALSLDLSARARGYQGPQILVVPMGNTGTFPVEVRLAHDLPDGAVVARFEVEVRDSGGVAVRRL